MTPSAKPDFVEEFGELHAQELEQIQTRRRERGLDDAAPHTGLALSGGGVHSTAFGLGVARALYDRGVYQRLDYLSTVGSGGFAGAFIGWLRRHGAGVAADADTIVPVAALRYIRRHATDPSPRPGAVLAPAVLALAVYGSLLIGLFFLLHIADSALALSKPVLLLGSRADLWFFFVQQLNFALFAGLVLLSARALRVVAAPVQRALEGAWRASRLRAVEPSRSQAWLGAWWFVLGLLALVLTLVALASIGQGPAAALAAALLGAAAVRAFGRWRAHWQLPEPRARERAGAWLSRSLALIAASLVTAVVLGVLGYYVFASGQGAPGEPTRLNPWVGLLLGLFAGGWSIVWVPRALGSVARFAANLLPGARGSRAESLGERRQYTLDGSLSGALRWIVLGSVPGAAVLLARGLHSPALLAALASASVLGAALWIVARGLGRRAGGTRRGSRAASVSRNAWLRACVGRLIVYGGLLVAYALSAAIVAGRAPGLAFLLVAVALVVGALSELNLIGPGRIYHERLAEAFLPDARAVQENRTLPALAASEFALSRLESESTGPYHLLNASLITTGSADPRLRRRGADSFVLSALYCGSEATGWARTQTWLEGRLTLGDAMGISAAGAGERGGARGWRPRMVLGLLDSSPGYWADNPRPRYSPRPSRWAPNLLRPGLRHASSSAGFAETARHVYLSGGGALENLGLYELLRRGVALIFVSDATEDPHRQCPALGQALARAQADFGVEVQFEPGALQALAFRPSDETPSSDIQDFALGEILYPNREEPGSLVYLKAGSFERHPGEAAFQAYEQLGYRIGSEAVAHLAAADGGADRSSRQRASMFRLKGEPTAKRTAGGSSGTPS